MPTVCWMMRSVCDGEFASSPSLIPLLNTDRRSSDFSGAGSLSLSCTRCAHPPGVTCCGWTRGHRVAHRQGAFCVASVRHSHGTIVNACTWTACQLSAQLPPRAARARNTLCHVLDERVACAALLSASRAPAGGRESPGRSRRTVRTSRHSEYPRAVAGTRTASAQGHAKPNTSPGGKRSAPRPGRRHREQAATHAHTRATPCCGQHAVAITLAVSSRTGGAEIERSSTSCLRWWWYTPCPPPGSPAASPMARNPPRTPPCPCTRQGSAPVPRPPVAASLQHLSPPPLLVLKLLE